MATDLGVPRSTARGWLAETPTVVVCLDVTEFTEPELRQEVLKLGVSNTFEDPNAVSSRPRIL